LVHSVPSVKGIDGSPWIDTATPSFTPTSMPQVSGQSCGHAARTSLTAGSAFRVSLVGAFTRLC
jgi:hypothetical protein